MDMLPKIKANNPGKRHQRPHEDNQQIAKSMRPQLPRDGSANGQNHISNKMPAGFISTWDFGNGSQTKYAPTSGGGKKVY